MQHCEKWGRVVVVVTVTAAELIREEEGRYKKVTFFLLQGAVILKEVLH